LEKKTNVCMGTLVVVSLEPHNHTSSESFASLPKLCFAPEVKLR